MDFKKLHKGNFNVIGSSPCRCTEHLQNYIGFVSLTILILGYLCTVYMYVGFFSFICDFSNAYGKITFPM